MSGRGRQHDVNFAVVGDVYLVSFGEGELSYAFGDRVGGSGFGVLRLGVFDDRTIGRRLRHRQWRCCEGRGS